jgi:hypothetical protein
MKKRISSNLTVWHRRVLPSLILGLIALFGVIDLLKSPLPLGHFAGVVGALLLGVVLFKHYSFSLAEEVLDDGDALIVRSDGAERRIPLSEIEVVKYAPKMGSARVVLRLKSGTPSEITFVAPHETLPWSANQSIEDLVARVKRLRSEVPR